MKRIAIVQSSYIPWRGYFDLIRSVDEFVLLDDVQFTRRDWRNRNQIKTPAGLKWLTIPVQVTGRYTQKVDETVVADQGWTERHWGTLVSNYSKAPEFGTCRHAIEELYRGCRETRLSLINQRFLGALCRLLEIKTPFSWSRDYSAGGSASEKLIAICRQAGAGVYLSGPAAKAYLDEAAFARAGIGLEWMNYDGYPAYRQLHGAFQPQVSIIDLLFNEGPRAASFLDRTGPIPP